MLFFDKLTAFITRRLATFIQSLQTRKKITKEQKEKIEDFVGLINESLEHNNISKNVAKLLKDGLQFYNMKVKHLMTPIDKVVSIHKDMSIAEAVKLGYEKQISRFPIYKGEKNKWVGVLSIYDVIFYFEPGDWDRLEIAKLMRPLSFVYEELTSDEVLLKIQKKSQPFFAVNDKQGNAIGIISSTDIIRPLLGEIA